MPRSYLSLFCPNFAPRIHQLVGWCDRYSPLVAQDGADGIILDLTGCTHLFGGEGPLLLDIQQRLRAMGIPSHAAIADTWGIAWALARFGNKLIVHGHHAVAAVEPLPVEALRLSTEVVFELRRLGLTTIAHVRKVPRRSLSARFGASFLTRLDQIFQHAEDPLTPWRPPAPYRASRILGEPIATLTAVEHVLHEMLLELCARMEREHRGSRHMELACYRVDGSVDRCEARTSKPVRSIPHLMSLFRDRLEKLWAEFGFELFVLSVLDIEALEPVQLSFTESPVIPDDATFDALVDRLGMKLGYQEVNRVRVRESLLPEHAVELRPAAVPATAVVSTEWPTYRIRPIRWIDPPMRVEVSAMIPGSVPVQFLIGQRAHRVVRSEGPERLTAEWWREPASRWTERDYYRVEDEQGLRFWMFRDQSGNWFLHGHLP